MHNARVFTHPDKIAVPDTKLQCVSVDKSNAKSLTPSSVEAVGEHCVLHPPRWHQLVSAYVIRGIRSVDAMFRWSCTSKIRAKTHNDKNV
jgi:hypothetical protein